MPELGLDTLGRSNRGKSAPNPLDPELLTAQERLAEVASLLARGFLRHRLRAAKQREKPLAIPAEPSLHWVKPKSEEETR
jgi:hypothetical protein